MGIVIEMLLCQLTVLGTTMSIASVYAMVNTSTSSPIVM